MTLLVSMIVRVYMMLTYAVDCISNYRTLLTGALRLQAHANRPELYELPVELKVTTGVYQLLSVGWFF